MCIDFEEGQDFSFVGIVDRASVVLAEWSPREFRGSVPVVHDRSCPYRVAGLPFLLMPAGQS